MTESKELALTQLGEMSVTAVVDRKRKLVEVMDAVMKEGEHYGKIPGCDKPCLFKAGAEVLATTFGLAPRFEVAERELLHGHREYRITCTLRHIASGVDVAEGVGSCSTMESKYRWRRGERICPECGKVGFIIKGRVDYGGGWLCFAKKGGCGAKFTDGAAEIEDQRTDRVENPDIADVWNTVLKMAKKRAQVDATLTAVGASDILTQDLEDLPLGSAARENADPREVIEASAVERQAPSATRAPRPAEPSFEALASQATSVSELQQLAPRFNSLPKGSPQRKTAYDAYTRRMEQLRAAQGATA